MIDNYLLEELITFKQTGTLAETAKRLNLTQPSITRGMKKLEAEFGVKLFERSPNRMKLTKAGELAVEEAVQVLKANQEMVQKVQNYAGSEQILKVASIIPGPLILERVCRSKRHFKLVTGSCRC